MCTVFVYRCALSFGWLKDSNPVIFSYSLKSTGHLSKSTAKGIITPSPGFLIHNTLPPGCDLTQAGTQPGIKEPPGDLCHYWDQGTWLIADSHLCSWISTRFLLCPCSEPLRAKALPSSGNGAKSIRHYAFPVLVIFNMLTTSKRSCNLVKGSKDAALLLL